VIKQVKQIIADSKKTKLFKKESYEAKMLKVDKLITEEKRKLKNK
jgi:hypothetical protein